jgi:hypothetical protein
LSKFLIQLCFHQALADSTLFLRFHDAHFIGLFVYVDDILLFGTYLSAFSFIKKALDHAFDIKDFGILKYFLGLEIAHSSTWISVTQRKYCLDLLLDAGLLDCKPATPLLILLLNCNKVQMFPMLMLVLIEDL